MFFFQFIINLSHFYGCDGISTEKSSIILVSYLSCTTTNCSNFRQLRHWEHFKLWQWALKYYLRDLRLSQVCSATSLHSALSCSWRVTIRRRCNNLLLSKHSTGFCWQGWARQVLRERHFDIKLRQRDRLVRGVRLSGAKSITWWCFYHDYNNQTINTHWPSSLRHPLLPPHRKHNRIQVNPSRVTAQETPCLKL